MQIPQKTKPAFYADMARRATFVGNTSLAKECSDLAVKMQEDALKSRTSAGSTGAAATLALPQGSQSATPQGRLQLPPRATAANASTTTAPTAVLPSALGGATGKAQATDPVATPVVSSAPIMAAYPNGPGQGPLPHFNPDPHPHVGAHVMVIPSPNLFFSVPVYSLHLESACEAEAFCNYIGVYLWICTHTAAAAIGAAAVRDT